MTTKHVEYIRYKGWVCTTYLNLETRLYDAIANKNGCDPIWLGDYKSTISLFNDIKQIIDQQSVQSAPKIRCQVIGGNPQ